MIWHKPLKMYRLRYKTLFYISSSRVKVVLLSEQIFCGFGGDAAVFEKAGRGREETARDIEKKCRGHAD